MNIFTKILPLMCATQLLYAAMDNNTHEPIGLNHLSGDLKSRIVDYIPLTETSGFAATSRENYHVFKNALCKRNIDLVVMDHILATQWECDDCYDPYGPRGMQDHLLPEKITTLWRYIATKLPMLGGVIKNLDMLSSLDARRYGSDLSYNYIPNRYSRDIFFFLQSLPHLTQLENITIRRAGNACLEGLGSSANSLKRLKITFDQDSSLNFLGELPALSDLRLISYFAQPDIILHDFHALADCRSLQSLKIDGFPLQNVGPITALTHLQYLRLYRCGLTDISFLTPLVSLKKLQLNSNPIVDVSPLAALTNLECLDLSCTDTVSIQAVVNLSKLWFLDVNNCNNLPVVNIELLNTYRRDHHLSDITYVITYNDFQDIIPFVSVNPFDS